MTIIMYDGPLNGVLSPSTTGARAIFEYRPSQTALCIHTYAETRAQARKCGSKRYLGRWAFMTTGPIEQVRRSGYTHIKLCGKRFHYSFVYSTRRLCTMQRLFAREKRPRGDKRSQRRAGRAKNRTSATRFSGTKRRGSRPAVVDKTHSLSCKSYRFRSPEIMFGLIIKSIG